MKLFVGAKALIFNEKNKFLLVRESAVYEEGTETGRWDVVGGRIEPEEKLLDGLKREVFEESKLDIEVGNILGVTENFPEIKSEEVHIVRIYYACTAKNNSEVVLSSDHDLYKWVSIEESNSLDVMEDVREIIEIYRKTL